MGDSNRLDTATNPVSVAILVVGFAGSTVVVRAVDLDDDGAAVSEDGEVGAAHTSVAQPLSLRTLAVG